MRSHRIVRPATCRETVEFASAAIDHDLSGIGGSPALGDLGATGVAVPSAPTVSQVSRYLIRLCGVQVPNCCGLIVRGIRQAVTLRGTVFEDDDPTGLIVKHTVTDPFWRFIDGNISWHLRLEPNEHEPMVSDPNQNAGTSPGLYGLSSSLLYTPPLVPYVPPAAGLPPGDPVGDLGTWRDLRFPWTNNDWDMRLLFVGPCKVILYASVHQTEPVGRIAYPNLPGMSPEDLFVSSFPDAIYDRVAGALICEFMPDCVKENM